MEEYFFKMTTNLFELQREFDKRTVHLIPDEKGGDEDDEGVDGRLPNQGWHRISHIMEDMGKDQIKYLKSGINETVKIASILGLKKADCAGFRFLTNTNWS